MEMPSGRKKTARAPGFFAGGGILFVAALGLMTAAAYFPAAGAGFVWDDVILTTLESIRGWGGIREIWLDPAAAYRHESYSEAHYWPLLYTTFWLEHKLWGFAPAGYHAVNILVHFANSALVWLLLRRLGVPGAALAAAIFAVHPLHTEPVAWVIARKDLLSGLFCLAAALAWLRFEESPRPRSYAAALSLFAAAMLCKSTAVALPAALLILGWWKRGGASRGGDLLRLAPFFLAGFAMAVADAMFYRGTESVSLGYSAAERVVIASRALWFYAGKLAWPSELAIVYPRWEVNAADPLAWGYAAAALAAVLALWFLRRRIGRGPLAAVAFFTVSLSPVLGFVDYGYMQFSFVADRYAYLAGMGIIALFGAAAALGTERLPRGPARKAAAAVAVGALFGLGAATWNQCAAYRDNVSFYGHILSFNPQARGIRTNLGIEMFRLGRYGEAEEHARAALEVNPRDSASLKNLADSLWAQDRHEEAFGFYRAAAEIDTSLSLPLKNTHMAAGAAFMKRGRYGEAERHLRAALETDPDDELVLLHLGELSKKRGRYREALGLYRSATAKNPEFAKGYAGAGEMLFRLGRYEEAVSNMERAFALRPELGAEVPGLHYLAGVALEEMNRPDEAEKHYGRALEADPGYRKAAEALNRLRGGKSPGNADSAGPPP